MKKVLLTGCAGFIGYFLAKRFLSESYRVIGIDNLNDYYDVTLKKNRLKQLNKFHDFKFIELNLENNKSLNELFKLHSFSLVLHMAAQAGVRYSIINPHSYINSNILAFVNVLEACRFYSVDHFIFASSSSVYGANTQIPFSVSHGTDHPVSFYGSTKKSNELIAHSYSSLYNIPSTGIRFFTVYGEWGRPDMAYFSFTKAILEGIPIQIFNKGKMKRDFTYIKDVAEGVYRLSLKIPKSDSNWKNNSPNPASSYAPYQILNMGSGKSIELEYLITILEKYLQKKAIRKYKSMQSGDVVSTFADISDLSRLINFSPTTSFEDGILNFVRWYKNYYK